MPASGAHAREAPVNEPSGARFFCGVWVEIGHRTHGHGEHLKLGRELTDPKCRFPRSAQVKIERAQVWRAWRGAGAPLVWVLRRAKLD